MIRQKRISEFLIVFCIFCLLFGAEILVSPTIQNIKYKTPERSGTLDNSPLSITAQSGAIDAQFALKFRPYQTTSFTITPDNCITALTINGTDGPSNLCTMGLPVTVDLDTYLSSGQNSFHMTITDTLGKSGILMGFSMRATGWKLSLIQFLRLLTVYGYMTSLFIDFIAKKKWWLSFIFFAGIVLRIMYVSVTPYFIREYDTAEHFRYIQFVADYWAVPHAAHGWEFHQGPLYYFVMALPLSLSRYLGLSTDTAKIWIQGFSLFFSVATLGIGIWMATLLFNKAKSKWGEIIFSLIIACAPVLLFASNRISNDGLYFLVAFLFLAYLLKWWDSAKDDNFFVVSIIIGISFLTRANAYVFLPILLLCCVLRTDKTRKERMVLIVYGTGVVAIIAGWLLALRYMENDFSRIFLTHDGNGAKLHLQNSLKAFLIFNPQRITQAVFPNMWIAIGTREYLWEMTYQSAFFGYWQFIYSMKNLGFWMLQVGFGVLALALAGIPLILKRRTYAVPVLISLFVFLSTYAYYRFLHACACNQDIRYIPLIVPLFGYLAVLAAEELHPKFVWIFRLWLLWFIGLCFLFFFKLWLG